MSKSMPRDELQTELRKTFGRLSGSTTPRALEDKRDASPSGAKRHRGKAASRQSGIAAKRESVKPPSRPDAIPLRRNSGKAPSRALVPPQRKLTCPLDAALYKQLQLAAVKEERPIKRIIDELVRQYLERS